MRRSARTSEARRSQKAPVRHDSPTDSEPSVRLVTPSVSPTPEQPKRQHATPGTRPDGQPKRPMNAFILFSNEMRSVLADENPHLSNAAVSVLLGQRWRDMSPHDKAGYVSAAKRIKEDFHLQHPDAKTRCVSRKAKRAKLDHAGAHPGRGAGRGGGRGATPPSLQALALVGSRLNEGTYPEAPFKRCDSASTNTQGSTYGSRPSFRDEDDDDDDEYDDEQYDDEDEASQWDEHAVEAPASEPPFAATAHQPTLLEQLCSVAETEHTAAAQMLSALGAC